jgi:hypothetical protein
MDLNLRAITARGFMNKRILIGITMFAAITIPLSAQDQQRRATMVGGGDRDRGKCTVEVLVDGRAEVDIRGDTATLRDLGGAAPQWRRFECSGPMPNNPAGFRFSGVNGRGNQRLVRDPNNGGTAAVQIEDPENGAGVYTFDIIWGGAGYLSQGDQRDRGDRRRFSQDDAVRSCQDAVRQQAVERFRVREVAFRRLEANDNPGQRDSVKGVFDLRRDGRDEAFRFSCSVDFDNGRVFNAQIESFGGDRVGQSGDRDRGDRGNPGDRAVSSCQRAVEERIMRDGYRDVRIDGIRVDDRPGRNDRVIGDARADSQGGRAAFTFSCSVDLADGDVRSVDVQPAR